jgi:DNA repair exonuclease SbcCD ATPase subunit
MRGQENCGGSVPEVEAIFQEICDLRKRLEEAEKELKFQRVFEAAFADKLKEFGTIDRLIEEYSAAKMARREAEKENARLLSALIVHREHAMHCPMLAQKPTE